MDFLSDQIFSDLSRSDFVGGIDNEALDFEQLEQFMQVTATVESLDDTNTSSNSSSNAHNHTSHNNNNNHNDKNLICGTKLESPSTPPNLTNETNLSIAARVNLIGSSTPIATPTAASITTATTTVNNSNNSNNNNSNQSTHLPESPPDSGSEPPYSPLQDVQGLTLTSREIYSHANLPPPLPPPAPAPGSLHDLQQQHMPATQFTPPQQQHLQQTQPQHQHPHHFPHHPHQLQHSNIINGVTEGSIRVKHEAGLIMNPNALLQHQQQQQHHQQLLTSNSTLHQLQQHDPHTSLPAQHQLMYSSHGNINSGDNNNLMLYDNIAAFAGFMPQDIATQESAPCLLTSIGDATRVQVIGTSHTPRTAPSTPVHLSSSRKRKLSTQLDCPDFDSIKPDPTLLSINPNIPLTSAKLLGPTSPISLNMPSTPTTDIPSNTPAHSLTSVSPALSTINSNLENSLDGNNSGPSAATPGNNAGDPTDPNALMPCIHFNPFQPQNWHKLCDQSLQELSVVYYRVDADKGFNFSVSDDAFVCQKKNHFQITCHARLQGEAKFVKTPSGLEKIKSFHLHFYGVKLEAPNQTIRVEQSQSDRSKKPFFPVPIDLQSHIVSKVTVGRLHFSETTNNNMRKKGRPNPEQRYFQLVVGLHVHTMSGNFPVISQASERIIVRASNPGQFESDVDLCWQRGMTQDSIFHAGRVGINTDRPDESLVVHGNLKVSGHIVQPSDSRAKQEIGELDTSVQLRNLQKIRIVRYRYEPQFALHSGLRRNGDSDGEEIVDTGVIAQEVREVIPDAVKEAGSIVLPNGSVIENFLLVNKDRILMENIGAVKELCKVTGSLETRIEHLERINNHLTKRNAPKGLRGRFSKTCTRQDGFEVCSNRSLQIIIFLLVIVMAACLAAVSTLYFVEHNKQHQNFKQLESLQVLASGNLFPPDPTLIDPEKQLIQLHNIIKLNNRTHSKHWPNFLLSSVTTPRSSTRNNTNPSMEFIYNESSETHGRNEELVVVMDKPVVREQSIKMTTTAPSIATRSNKTISSKNKSKWPTVIRAAASFVQQKQQQVPTAGATVTRMPPQTQAPVIAITEAAPIVNLTIARSTTSNRSDKVAENVPLPQDFENNSIDVDAQHVTQKPTVVVAKTLEVLRVATASLNSADTAHAATLVIEKNDADITLQLAEHTLASTSSSNSINPDTTAAAHGLKSNFGDSAIVYNLYKTLSPPIATTTNSIVLSSEANLKNFSLEAPPTSNKNRSVLDSTLENADALDLQNLNSNNDSADNPITALFGFDFDGNRDSLLGRRSTSQRSADWLVSRTVQVPPFGAPAQCALQQEQHQQTNAEVSNCQSLCFEESNQLQPLRPKEEKPLETLKLPQNIDSSDLSLSIEGNSDSVAETDHKNENQSGIQNGSGNITNLVEPGKSSHPPLASAKQLPIEIGSVELSADTRENLHSSERLALETKNYGATKNDETLSIKSNEPPLLDCWKIGATIYADDFNTTFGIEDYCPTVGKSLNLTYVVPLSRFLKELSIELHLGSTTPLLWTICNDHEHTKSEGKQLISNLPGQPYTQATTLLRRKNVSMLLLNIPSRGFFIRDLALRGTNNIEKQNICDEQVHEATPILQYNFRILRDCD